MKEITDAFCIEVADVLGSLRPCLDYCFTDLHGRFVANRVMPHFPIADDVTTFNQTMTRYPGLPAAVVDYLRSVQPFADAENAWIALLRTENNAAKHTNFIAHSVVDRREVQLRSERGGVAVRVAEGGTLSVLPGGRIFGDVNLPGGSTGVTVRPRQPFPSVARGEIEEISIWRYVEFARDRSPVMGLVPRAIDGVDAIVENLSTV